MIRRKMLKAVKPESRKLGQYFALAGYQDGQNAVKSRNAVGGYKEQCFFVHLKDITDLSAMKESQTGNIALG
jgi:hypothetical protein